jgi:hypothetical protein
MLEQHVAIHAPDHEVFVIQGWDKATIIKDDCYANGYLMRLTGKTFRELLSTQPKVVLLFDEAQDSYWDQMLWIEFFKSVDPNLGPYIALFCSFGSDGPSMSTIKENDSWQTPLSFGTDQVIGMGPRQSARGLGLLLTFEDALDVMIRTLKQNPRLPVFDDQLVNFLISFSDGHVGCLAAMLQIIQEASIPVSFFVLAAGWLGLVR